VNALRREIAAAAIGTMTRVTPDSAARRFRFGREFVGFAGHFPGDPILPAVAQLAAVISLAEDLAGTPLRLVAVDTAKFMSPVRPDEEVEVAVTRRASAPDWFCDATVAAGEMTAASFRLRLATGA
jgi:3-hydroxyacyl-[acyl-carrier-protein] dehydratase